MEVQGPRSTGARRSALDHLLGTWGFTMHHAQVAEPITGHYRYERVLDGAFVLHRCTYDHAEFPDAMALVSDEKYHYFDVRGIIRVFGFEIDDKGWSMLHMDEEFSQRTAARFEGPD